MTGSMQASVLADVRRLELREVPRPSPAPDEILLAVSAVGVCGTDFHIYSGESNYNLDGQGRAIPLTREPQILGHEVVGTVTEVGARVTRFRPGQDVVIDQGLCCASKGIEPTCEYCATGASHQCEHYQEFGITGLAGGFAEAMAVPALCAVGLRHEIDPAVAAMCEPLACVLHSTRLLGDTPARYTLDAQSPANRVRTILVQGAGPAGLLFMQVLRQCIAFDGLLLVSEPNPTRAALARRFGAEVIDPEQVDLADAVLDRSGGRGVELLIEASGSGRAFCEIPRLIRKQATVLKYGIGYGGSPLEWLNMLHWKEPTLLMPVGASGHFPQGGEPEVYRQALSLIEEGTIEVAPIVSHRYRGLSGLEAAFSHDHTRPEYVKGVALL